MKIRSGDTFKQIKIKAEILDTLPTGSVVDYEGETVPEGWSQVDDPNTYSTNETRIGTWIDGKTLYRKVVNIGKLTPNSKTDYSTGLSNVDVKRLEGYFEARNNVFMLNHINNLNRTPDNYEAILLYTINMGNLIRVENANVTNTDLDCWVIMEYTKR